jgi:hypothetical protein
LALTTFSAAAIKLKGVLEFIIEQCSKTNETTATKNDKNDDLDHFSRCFIMHTFPPLKTNYSASRFNFLEAFLKISPLSYFTLYVK